MFISRLTTTVLLLAFLQSSAHAFVTRFDVRPVEPDSLPGFQTFDVLVTGTDELIGGTGQLNGLQMRFDPFDGSIYQDPAGTNLAPSPFTAEFDTFVSVGGPFPVESHPAVIHGGAIGLGGGSELTFDESKLDIAWAPVTPIYAPRDLFVARITVPDGTAGTLSLLGSTLGEPDRFYQTTIGFHGDPAVIENPPSRTIIALDDAIESSGGVLADAITLMPLFVDRAVVIEASFDDGNFFSVEDVIGQEIGFSDDFERIAVAIDVAFTGITGHGLSPGTIVTDELNILTTAGGFRYTLAATIPVPEPCSLVISMLGLVTLGAHRLSRRQSAKGAA